MRSGAAFGEYLWARRALVQPEQVGLDRDPMRKVPGLRRAEVATVAGISAEYYLRLEQGRGHVPSDAVLRALARALVLDGASTAFMIDLAHGEVRRKGAGVVDESVRALLAEWRHLPVLVRDRNHDVLEVNQLAAALGGVPSPGRGNLVVDVFTERAREAGHGDWATTAERSVAALRLSSDPDDPRLREIVGTLSTRDDDFRRLWARYDTVPWPSGRSRHVVEPIGAVELAWQEFDVPGSGVTLRVFWADPGSADSAALAYLASTVGGRADVRRTDGVPSA